MKKENESKNRKIIFRRPVSLRDVPTHYCPGCGHGVVHRLVAEVVDELGIRERVVGIAPVGCAVLAYDYFNFDMTEAPHGRPPAVATGMKRSRPDLIVFTYQGDGDLAAIGTAETIHAANRGENITIIFVNNGVYGMTGGQMAPTTLLEQVTKTTPRGRFFEEAGPPLKVCEMLAPLDGTTYIARSALDKPANILKARRYIKHAFLNQIEGEGFSLVEILSPCPVYWGLSPLESVRRLGDTVVSHFPLGIIKDVKFGREKQ